MKNQTLILIISIICLFFVSFSYIQLQRQNTTDHDEQIAPTFNPLATSYKPISKIKEDMLGGKKITATSTLEKILAVSGYDKYPHPFINAYQYGNLIYASVSSGESGEHKVYAVKNDTYTLLTQGQDYPLCSSFIGYEVPIGLWCRLGGSCGHSTSTQYFSECWTTPPAH